MKKQIIALMVALITIFTCCGFAISEYTNEADAIIDYVEEVTKEEALEEEIIEFKIEKLEEFKDKNLLNYSMDELQELIEEQRNIQLTAHELAESARKLGWPENSEPLISAGNEWWNAQKAIDVYGARYQELYDAEVARWAEKKAQYPAATEIWLYMKDLGWNDYVCAGIMGNLMAEVGGQTLNIRYTLYGNNYYGMCQWSRGYSQIWGADLNEQCDFLRDTIKYELDTFGYAYSKGFNYNSFLNMTNEREAAKAFAKCYERCSSATYGIRMSNATKAYNYFVNN